jgi:hypothetical protein
MTAPIAMKVYRDISNATLLLQLFMVLGDVGHAFICITNPIVDFHLITEPSSMVAVSICETV